MSESLSSSASQVRASIAAIIEPLRVEHERLEALINEKQTELDELRRLQREVTNARHAVDPEFAERRAAINAKRVNGIKKTKSVAHATRTGMGVSTTFADEVYDWLVSIEAECPDGFVASQLARRPDRTYDQARLSNAFKYLHAQDRLRLDHLGDRNAKHFKLAGSS